MKWFRVSKENPCTICNKIDWCTFLPEKNIACCMRVPSGKHSRNDGYIHPLNGDCKQVYVKPEAPEQFIDCEYLMKKFSDDTRESDIESLACKLGVSLESLKSIGCQRANAHKSFAFPMYDGFGEMVGIRLRKDNGGKFAIRGSHQGVFLAKDQPSKTTYIVEGVSDLAALLTIGLFGFGRPSCSGCVDTINGTLKRLRSKRVVIVSDSDEPGLRGADSLQKSLSIPSTIYCPPCKDLRESARSGMTKSLIESTVSQLVWFHPKTTVGGTKLALGSEP